MNRIFILILISIAAVILSGCGNTPPELKQIYSQINISRSPESGKQIPELVVFVSADDKDGPEDIESLHIINEKKQFFWDVYPDSWSIRSSRGMEWMGYERFMTVDGSFPEPGEYRVLVTDRAGERTEDSIFIPLITEQPADEDFPMIIFIENSDDIEIVSPEKQNIITFYNQKGKLIGAFGVTPGQVKLKKLKDGASILENYKVAEISYYSSKFGAGLVSGPFLRQ